MWQDAREQDPAEAAQIDVAYVGAGIMTVNEVRQNMGLLPLAEGAAIPGGVKKKLGKGAADDDEEEDDEDDGDDDFDALHPRWPAGTPGGAGGEFAPKDAAIAAPDPDRGSLNADAVRSAILDGMWGR